MLSYSLNRIMIPGIIPSRNVVNTGHRPICVKVKSIGRKEMGFRDRILGQDKSFNLVRRVVEKH